MLSAKHCVAERALASRGLFNLCFRNAAIEVMAQACELMASAWEDVCEAHHLFSLVVFVDTPTICACG